MGELLQVREHRPPCELTALDELIEQSRRLIRGQHGCTVRGPLNWSDRVCDVVYRCERLDRERERLRTRRLKREPVRAADVARVYFAHHAIGEFPTRREIIERLRITEPAARRDLSARLQEVLDVARELFADYRRTT
ncbi:MULTISPECIES: hypothetical protein [unclassified Brachybacterium]|uniref:hypothetical protein n=1 Tax=unclassified Brachybacterium TaxID=2623841 RepID=UPI003F946BC4